MCFLIKLGRHVGHGERMNPIDFEGQRSRSQWTYMEISIVYFFIKLGRHVKHVYHDERMNPIDFGG